jgi:dipeptidyl-peptidase-3
MGTRPSPGQFSRSSILLFIRLNDAWAHFSILKHLLQSGSGVLRIIHNPATDALTVHVDRSKILPHGKPALGEYLCRLHIWRCTADVASRRAVYEPLCAVDGVYEQWRHIVCSKSKQRWKFVQPSTFVRDGDVEVRRYEETNEGIVRS